jgi:hypothetical protein
MSSSGCAAVLADRKAHDERHAQMVHRMDSAHVFVTSSDLPKDKPYKVLGDLKYSAPFSTVTIDTAEIESQLKAMALAKYPDSADAVIKANGDVDCSGPAVMVNVTGEVIQFESSADRVAMHNVTENLVVSPKWRERNAEKKQCRGTAPALVTEVT